MAGCKESIGHGALDLSRYVDGLAVGDGEAAGCDLCKGVCSTAQSKSRVEQLVYGQACTFPRFNKMKSRPLCKAWLACEKEFVRSHVSLQRVGAAACFPHPFQKTPSHSLPFLP